MALGKTQEWAQSQAPHWMRLLEDKYQRLHAKILNQAARFTHRRSASLATTRCLRESQRKQTACGVNSDHRGLASDQELVDTPQAVQGPSCERAQINRAAITSHNVLPVSRAKTAKLLSKCVSKQSSYDTVNPSRPQTQKGTRSSGFIDNTRQTEGSSNCYNKGTPISSGVVTRASSAYPFTRLSSAYDLSRPSPRNLSTLDQTDQEDHAEQLNWALHLQLENHKDEIDENDKIFDTGLRLDFIKNGRESILSYDDQKDDMMNVKCYTDRDDVTGRGRRRRRAVTRPVKTSISRISHKTTKSCPATLVGNLDINNGNSDYIDDKNINKDNGFTLPSKSSASVGSLSSKGLQAGRMRVFARMSLEARHAIDETLKEMKMEEDMQPAKPSDPDDNNPSCVEESINNFNTSADSVRNNVSAQTGEELTADQRLKTLFSDGLCPQNGERASSDASLLSTDSQVYATNSKTLVNNNNKDGIGSTVSRNKFSSFGGFPRDGNNNIQFSSVDSRQNIVRKLPQLGETGSSFQERFPNPHAPLPAIGRINNKMPLRESTFEITPPDFDIRFREIITCQKGDRETPPLDVRQQSIDKCEQWLVRYTPRR